jgi:hypothetical protein
MSESESVYTGSLGLPCLFFKNVVAVGAEEFSVD